MKTDIDWPEATSADTVDTVMIIIQMTMHYIFRHEDFIPIANNFVTPASDPHTPSKATRNCRFNTIVVNTWVLLSILIHRSVLDSDAASTSDVKSALTDVLLNLHDELGEREICGAAKGTKKKEI